MWSIWAIPSLLVLIVGWIFAAVVLAARPRQRQNQLLALLLVHGAAATALITCFRWVTTTAETAKLMLTAFLFAALLIPLVYLAFLGTLRSPLSKPFRTPIGLVVVAAATLGAFAAWFVRPAQFLVAGTRVPSGAGEVSEAVWGPWFGFVALAAVTTYLYGLVVAVSALRQAQRPIARAQARAYAAAFVLRDAFTALNIVLVTMVLPQSDANRRLNDIGFVLIDLAFFSLLAYGVLHAQLFGIELRLKSTIRGSAVAAAFTVAFFVGKESIEALVNADGLLFGIGTAFLVSFAFRPLHAAAARLAHRLMPHVQDSPTYHASRRREIYEAAHHSFLEDGRLGVTEKKLLSELRARLGLSDEEARRATKADAVRLSGARRPAVRPRG